MQRLNEIINHQVIDDFITDTTEQIAKILTLYNIGYLQNQPLVMDDGIEYKLQKPAFWLPQDGNVIIDITDDDTKGQNMSDVYASNGFDTIIITPAYTSRPIWQYELYEQINGYINHQPSAYDMLPIEYR